MGEEKRKRARLGEWYGKPIVPGHPDYIAPVKAPAQTKAKPAIRAPGLSLLLLASMGHTLIVNPRGKP